MVEGAIQFPIDQPLPLKLVTRIVKNKIQENNTKLAAKVKNIKAHKP